MKTSSQGITPLLFFLLLAVPFSAAEDDPYIDGANGLDPLTTIILALTFAGILIGAGQCIYHNCCVPTAGSYEAPPVGRLRKGLVRSEIESFPTFCFSEVKNLTLGQRAPDCAVCLAEFADDATLRLLPECDHAFHALCIDAWLAEKTTCPVCRSNLLPVAAEIRSPRIQLTAPPSGSGVEAATAENSDRCRLRLPEEARKKILAVAPSARKEYRTGEGGSHSNSGSVKPAGDGEATAAAGGDASHLV